MAVAVVLTGSAATIAKRVAPGMKPMASASANRSKKSVFKSKLNSTAPVMKADDYDDDDEIVELPVPTGVKLEKNAQGAIEVTWDAVPGANYYQAVGSMIAPVAVGDEVTLVNADFSNFKSSGTLEEPEYSDYLVETYDAFPGAQFILPAYVNGAVGVEDNIYYAWLFGYYAGIEVGSYDLSIAKDAKVTVTMEVASGTGADLYCELYAWDEAEGDYVNADSYVKEALTTNFQTLTFDLTGVNEDCIFSFYPFGDPDTYEFDGNVFFRSIKITMVAGEEGEIEVPILVWEGEEIGASIAKENVVEGNTYSAAVMAYQLDDEGYILGESDYSDPVYYTAPAGISDVTVDTDTTAPVYYNLQGIRLDRPEGLCIEVKGGKAQKVVK